MKKAVLMVVLVLIIVGSGVMVAAKEQLSAQDRRVNTELRHLITGASRSLQEGDVVVSSKTGAKFEVQKEGSILVFVKIEKGCPTCKDHVTLDDMGHLYAPDKYGEGKRFQINPSEAPALINEGSPAAAPAAAGTGTGPQSDEYLPGGSFDFIASRLGYKPETMKKVNDGVFVYRDNNNNNKFLYVDLNTQKISEKLIRQSDKKTIYIIEYDLNGKLVGLSYLNGVPKDSLYNVLYWELPEELRAIFNNVNEFDKFRSKYLPAPLPQSDAQVAQKTAKKEVEKWQKEIAAGQLTAGEASAKAEELAVDMETLAKQNREKVAEKEKELKKKKEKEESARNEEEKKEIANLEKEIEELKSGINTLDEEAKTLHQQALQFQWQSHWFSNAEKWEKGIRESGYGQTLVTIQSLLARGSRWQALSNAWLGETEWYQAWFDISNNVYLQWWSNLPTFAATHTAAGLGWDACKRDDALRAEIPGQSAQFVETPSGTYQFVGSIMAERSQEKVAVLCERHPDEEAEEEFVCGKKQVCVKDFCYADEDKDGEPDPDADGPLKGYFYKVSWGVSAPADESFTPFVDEDRKAVRFNIQLVGEKSVWLYKRSDASGTAVLALENGANDRAVITHFSAADPPFREACIRYDPSYPIKDRYGDQVQDQCVEIIKSDRGTVEFTKSDRSESVRSSSTEVEGNNEW